MSPVGLLLVFDWLRGICCLSWVGFEVLDFFRPGLARGVEGGVVCHFVRVSSDDCR